MFYNRFNSFIKVTGVFGLCLLAACSSSDDTIHNFQYKSALNTFSSCDELSRYLVETGKQQKNLYEYVQNEGFSSGLFTNVIENDADTGSPSSAQVTLDESSTIIDYTGTNNQVSGVDEADFVKTDGQYTYIVTGGYFVIIDNWPVESAKELSRMELTGTPAELLIYQDIVWIVSQQTGFDNELGDALANFSSRVSQQTLVKMYDITDRSHPELLRETAIEGFYVAARRINQRVHLVTSASLDISYLVDGVQSEPDLNELLPIFTDVLYSNTEPSVTTRLISSCEHIFRPGTANGTSTISLLSFDLEEPAGDIQRQTIISNSGTVYANEEHLYIATTEDQYWSWLPVFEGDTYPQPGTTFHKFNLSGVPAYLASGRVDGYIINQFAMDEYQDAFRVLTTISAWWLDQDPLNSLYILGQSGTQLVQRSVLDNLGKPGERIYAARFLDEKGFLVTFQQIDPLYTLDLSDPDNPRVAGELEVPGFSTYLHPLDDELLLAIGRNASNDAIDLSLFDIGDFKNPELLFRESIGDGSYTEAQYNHKAFTWFSQQQMLALPVTRWQENLFDDGFYGYDVFNGLMVYQVNRQTGFEFYGEVDHSDLYKNEADLLWYYPDNIRRSFFTLDSDQQSYLYSISSRGIKVNSMPELESLVSLPLPVFEWQDNLLYW